MITKEKDFKIEGKEKSKKRLLMTLESKVSKTSSKEYLTGTLGDLKFRGFFYEPKLGKNGKQKPTLLIKQLDCEGEIINEPVMSLWEHEGKYGKFYSGFDNENKPITININKDTNDYNVYEEIVKE